MHGPIFGEFLGTLVLVMLGDAVVANVLLNKSKGQNSGWIVITAGWGLAVLCGILVSLGVGGVAHLNPAVTIALAVAGNDYSMVVPYIVAQMVGAFCAGVLVWVTYLPLWEGTADQGAKLGIFCTGPAVRNLPSNCVTELLGTIMLVLVGFAIGSKGVSATGLPPGLGPYFWGMLVWSIGLSLGGPTGYAINPARDLGPRLAHAVLPIPGKGGNDWGYAWVPVVAPAVGGAVGALICKATGIV
jgi:glycerol uptake facilitator protein